MLVIFYLVFHSLFCFGRLIYVLFYLYCHVLALFLCKVLRACSFACVVYARKCITLFIYLLSTLLLSLVLLLLLLLLLLLFSDPSRLPIAHVTDLVLVKFINSGGSL